MKPYQLAILTTLVLHIAVLGLLYVKKIDVPQDQSRAAEAELIEISPEELPKKVQKMLLEQDLTNKVSDSNAKEREQDFTAQNQGENTYQDTDLSTKAQEQIWMDSLRALKADRPDDSELKPSEDKPADDGEKTDGKTSQFSKAISSYDMAGRIGDIKNPGYTCRGTGQVRIEVEIDREGVVLSASIDESATAAGQCPREQALAYARRSSFSKSSSAPRRQSGSITYNFISQK